MHLPAFIVPSPISPRGNLCGEIPIGLAKWSLYIDLTMYETWLAVKVVCACVCGCEWVWECVDVCMNML